MSLYVHMPWCVRKCPYCDFNSHELRGALPEDDYVSALIDDLEAELPRVWGRTLDAMFIGGGTPSLFSGPSMERLLGAIRARLPMRPDMEITMEANPGASDFRRFCEYARAGVNRLSIGVQSFSDRHLSAIGRIHSGFEARQAYLAARQAGFRRINLDLMFGLPGQSLDEALTDLKLAIDLAPEHISWYQLTLEPNTLFYARPPQLPEDDLIADMAEAGQSLLRQAGYDRYEISAYAQPGERCQHNLNYWTFGDYLAIGAGAHGKITNLSEGTLVRYHKKRSPNDYVQTVDRRLGGEELVAPRDMVFEFMLNALRLVDGVDSALFSERTGLPLRWIESGMRQLMDKGLAQNWPARIQLSPLGLWHLNTAVEHFLPDALTASPGAEIIPIRQEP
jgi:oxygen-independent coproporphyrinogen-3 oxidase